MRWDYPVVCDRGWLQYSYWDSRLFFLLKGYFYDGVFARVGGLLQTFVIVCVKNPNHSKTFYTSFVIIWLFIAWALINKVVISFFQVLREFAINLLHYLAAADSGVARIIAAQSPCVSLLVAFIEQAEASALTVANQHGITALRDNPDCMGTSLDMLRRAARTLLHLSKHPDNRPLFMQQEQRLLALVMSQILDQQVAALISRVLYHCSSGPPSPEPNLP